MTANLYDTTRWAAFCEGDHAAFLALYKEHYNLLYIWAHRWVQQDTEWILEKYPAGNEVVPLLDELKHLRSDAGLSNAAIIQAATVNSARVTGLHDRGLVCGQTCLF
ncbi:hypothetical protein [Pseudoflavitalea rhizosphaerae]|uniref:hypothetical protein n=1 Tax=Pseudoflavitalea rhizosphaerae TaxID=1884793 RepID=UPI000F8C65F9|nr:hypothetical protein [Pseudoflavitalea rhizosphaerae]